MNPPAYVYVSDASAVPNYPLHDTHGTHEQLITENGYQPLINETTYEPITREQSEHQGQIAFSPQLASPQQPYPQQQPSSAQQSYPAQLPYPQQQQYPTQQPYPNQPQYPTQQPYPNQPQYPTQQPYPNQQPYPYQPQFPAQHPYAPQPPPYFSSTQQQPQQQPQQQQQASVMVVNTGQPQMVGYPQQTVYQSYCGHIALACLVFWFCGWLFGIAAFILALLATDRAAVGNGEEARRLGKASLGVSTAGIVVGTIIIVVIVAVGTSTATARQASSAYRTPSTYNIYRLAVTTTTKSPLYTYCFSSYYGRYGNYC